MSDWLLHLRERALQLVYRARCRIGVTTRLTPEVIAMALDNPAVCRAVSAVMTNPLRLAIAGVLLQGDPTKDGYFAPQDVRDEAEAGLRAIGVAKELKIRHRSDEAKQFRMMAERHQQRAWRILALLPEAEQQLLHQQINAGPLAEPPRSEIEVVRS